MRPMTKWLPFLAAIAIATIASAAAPKLTCTLTGKEVAKCCCVEKDGKQFCTLAKKTIDKCCCKGM
jgi:hypothetical protein